MSRRVELTKKQRRFFEEAKKEAEKSTFGSIKIGCVMVYNNIIIGRGYNESRTHPLQQIYNKKYRKFNHNNGKMIMDSLHAETSALLDAEHNVGDHVNWSKVHVFVYRICPGKKSGHGCSKCCSACQNLLYDKGIRSIFYTEDVGYNHWIMED